MIHKELTMMDNIKLKPCPFCGGEPMYSVVNHGDGGIVYCTKCGICTTSALTDTPYTAYEAAAAAWNRRVPEKEEN